MLSLRRLAASCRFGTASKLASMNPRNGTGVLQTSKRFMAKLPSAAKQKAPSTSPVTWIGLGVALALGGGGIYYVRSERDRRKEFAEKRKSQSAGKPAIGGPFNLLDTEGKEFSSDQLKGNWSILYFGFTFCPDVCPDELNKLTETLEIIDSTDGMPKLQPVFISIDPNRDTPEKIKGYLEDFHPRLIGLTGTDEQIRALAKLYRIYYSKPIDDDGLDYLVDHTIIMYLLNPKGEFAWYYGQNLTAPEMAEGIIKYISENDE